MVMCSRCQKRMAVIFITKLEGAEKKNEGVCLSCAKELAYPDLLGSVLHPSLAGKVLRKFAGEGGNDAALVVKNDAAGARGALIKSHQIFFHIKFSLLCACRTGAADVACAPDV